MIPRKAMNITTPTTIPMTSAVFAPGGDGGGAGGCGGDGGNDGGYRGCGTLGGGVGECGGDDGGALGLGLGTIICTCA